MSVFFKPRYAKVASFGEQGSGKTFSNILLAAGLHKELQSDRPLKCFDTEGGIGYQLDRIVAMTGKEPEGKAARSFVDLIEFTKTVKEGDIVIIDSATQPWNELLAAKILKFRRMRGIMSAKQDWQEQFTAWLLGFPAHVFVCGRAGIVFEERVDEATGEREISAVDTKLKAEGEFGYEPSLLLEWQRSQMKNDANAHEVVVRKDRFGIIDGKRYSFYPETKLLGDIASKVAPDYSYNPVFETFRPWFSCLDLKTGGGTGIDTSNRTARTLDDNGWSERQAEETERKVLLEEIASELFLAHPGQGAEAKAARIRVSQEVFGTSSWEALEQNFQGKYGAAELRSLKEDLAKKLASTPQATGKEK